MRRLPSLRRRGSWGPVEGAVWSGAVAIVHRPSSRDAAAQRRIIVPRFKRLEAERNDALHNEADALTCRPDRGPPERPAGRKDHRSEEHTSELQSLMRISYAVFCLKKKKTTNKQKQRTKKQIQQTQTIKKNKKLECK